MKTLGDFRRAHDPTHKLEDVGARFHRSIIWGKTNRAIVVAAQNATPQHAEFWKVLTYMAEQLGAEILVIPLRYKNPTSLWSGSQKNAEHWATTLRPFLWNVNEQVNPNFMVLGDLKVQPTNSDPLAGTDVLSHALSCVVGHTKVQTRSVATPASQLAKLLMTSGAITVPNYTDSRQGKLAEFHHSLSAVLVETKGKKFFARRLHYTERTRRVIDLGVAWYANRHEPAPPSLALVMGDTHVDFVDPKVVAATFDSGGIIERTRPQHLIWHDLLDGHTVNPHHEGNPFADLAKYYAQRTEAAAEVKRAITFVHERTRDAIKRTQLKDLLSIIVPSNHDDFLARWIKDKNWKTLPPENRIFYLETALHMARGTKMTERGIHYPDPFVDAFRAANVPNTRALDMDEDFILAGVALHFHGDKGANGTRGSIRNLKRITTKAIIGHSHSPGEDEGCTQVGTSTRLRAEYTQGASSWLNAHCDLNADGKRQLLVIVDGEFCL